MPVEGPESPLFALEVCGNPCFFVWSYVLGA